ncbi:IS3 family transposase [Pediococcus acidilactici]
MIYSLRQNYKLSELLEIAQLARSTYYDRLYRNTRPDKYAKIKDCIKKVFRNSNETYGYRRMHIMLKKNGYTISPNTVRRLMRELSLGPLMYSRHTSGYHSYKGHIGTINRNLLNQKFTATAPFTVLHTDITQVRLANHSWGYISVVMDGASREIITAVISEHANLKQLASTIDDLAVKLPINSKPILHSDQGWQYQHSLYQNAIKKLGITPSMSRRGNCHDNAPMESFFNLMKRECLYRTTIDDLDDLNRIVTEYIAWYNNQRISINKNGLTPVEFREQAIV